MAQAAAPRPGDNHFDGPLGPLAGLAMAAGRGRVARLVAERVALGRSRLALVRARHPS
jgi:hypothetical protein